MEDRCEKTEKRIGYAMVFFFIVFLFIASKCTAQMKIYRDHCFKDRPEIVSYYPYVPLTFPLKKDTIFFSVSGDSISPQLIEMKVYAYYTKGIKKHDGNITVGFEGGKACVFKPFYTDNSGKDLDYVEYEGNALDYYWLSYKQYLYVSFDGIKQFITQRNKENYFIEFHKIVYQKQ